MTNQTCYQVLWLTQHTFRLECLRVCESSIWKYPSARGRQLYQMTAILVTSKWPRLSIAWLKWKEFQMDRLSHSQVCLFCTLHLMTLFSGSNCVCVYAVVYRLSLRVRRAQSLLSCLRKAIILAPICLVSIFSPCLYSTAMNQASFFLCTTAAAVPYRPRWPLCKH